MVALIIALYLLVDLYLSHTLDIKVMVLFGIVFSVIIFGFLTGRRTMRRCGGRSRS